MNKYSKKTDNKPRWVRKKKLRKEWMFGRNNRVLEGSEIARMKTRVRDNFTCQDCGTIRTLEQAKKENKRLFDIHHLNGLCGLKNRPNSYDSVKDISGLVTLCHKCHFNRPEHRIHSEEYSIKMQKLWQSKKVINTVKDKKVVKLTK